MLSLAAAIQAAPGAPSSVRIGIITSLNPVTLLVQGASFSGDAVGVLGDIAGVGDPVVVLGQSKTAGSDPSSWVILGPAFPSTLGGPPQAKAWHSTLIGLADNTATPVPLQTELWDNDTIHDPTTANTRMLCTRSGRHLVMGSIGYAVNAVGRRMCQLRVNTVVMAEQSIQAVPTFNTIVEAVAELDLVVGDIVEMYALQSSGGPLNTVAAVQDSWLSMRRVGASVGVA